MIAFLDWVIHWSIAASVAVYGVIALAYALKGNYWIAGVFVLYGLANLCVMMSAR